MLINMRWPQIEDEQIVRKRELHKLYSEMNSLRQTYYRLEEIYKEKKRTYETIDHQRALRDGRLRVVKPTVKPPKVDKEMTQEQINKLIEELTELVK